MVITGKAACLGAVPRRSTPDRQVKCRCLPTSDSLPKFVEPKIQNLNSWVLVGAGEHQVVEAAGEGFFD